MNGRCFVCLDGIGRNVNDKCRTRRCAGQREDPNEDTNRHGDGSNSKDTLLQLDSVLQIASLSLIRRYGTSPIFFQKVSYHLPSATTKSTTKTLPPSTRSTPRERLSTLARVRKQ